MFLFVPESQFFPRISRGYAACLPLVLAAGMLGPSHAHAIINEGRVIRQYQYIEWPEDHCPINAAAIIDLVGVLQKAQLSFHTVHPKGT